MEIPEEPLSLVPEVSPEEADLIPPSSILRFRVERGDVPSCFVNCEAVSQAPIQWRDWAESVLNNPDLVRTLKASRALEPIRLSAELNIWKNNANIDLMVSRWSKDTHTFVCKAGGPLEKSVHRGGKDLPPLGTAPPTRQATKFYGKMYDSDLYLAGFLNYWLFFLRPYAELVKGALPTSFFSENDRIVDFQTEGVIVSASAQAAFVAACPCSLPALCMEGTRYVLYRPDRTFVGELFEGYNIMVLPRNDRETSFTANSRLAWRRNLDSFINYVRGVLEVPTFPDVYHPDISLRSPKVRQPGWRGKSSYWASPSVALVDSRGVTIAEPILTIIPPRVTRAKTKEQASSQQQGPQLKRLRKGAPTRFARTPCFEEMPSSAAFADPSPRYDGGEHTPLSKLKRKREDVGPRVLEEDFDSSIDDGVPISQSFKLPRAAQPTPSGKSVAEDKGVDDLGEGGSEETGSDAEDNDDQGSEGGEDSGADVGSGDRSNDDDDGGNHSDNDDVDGGEDDADSDFGGKDGGDHGSGDRSLNTPILRYNPWLKRMTRMMMQSPWVTAAIVSTFDRRLNVQPADDHSAHFRAHNTVMELAGLNSVEVFTDIQNDSLLSLETPQAGYVAGDFGEGSSLMVRGSMLQQQAEAGTNHGQEAIEDDSEVRVVEPPVSNEEEVLSNEAFFGQFRLSRYETSFLSFHYLGLERIEEIGHTVQDFDKLGFDIWWVYKELDAARIMRENEKLWRHCEGAKATLEEAHVAFVRAQDTMVTAEEVVEERRRAYERMVEEARLGERLIDVLLCDTDPFMKGVFGA
ncbi:hypothetical protein RHSIM_Rhsim04G0141600 [Rhododendron simsii]|uniref:Aminotransferase-like plant mobile domain-containing protein n=1 Tax=Rhododendron simsii TaxID=118357 RepID=A0A834LRS1_RHOSS|nr:hypothetical protein RHSIM_Rhsim04G0141600 [Rhododendron simsii]